MSTGAATTEIIQSFAAFGPFLRYLRRRVRLTQQDLGIAVGYSTPQISLLENGQRLPDLTTLAALFVPALRLDEEPELATRLLQLATAAHGHNDGLTITRTVRRQITITETVETTITSLPTAQLPITNNQSPGHPEGVLSIVNHQIPNLPAPVWPLISRESELEMARAVLLNRSARLLTFIGPPGVGKTRLALQLAWETYTAFTHGVHLVELAAIQEPALLIPTLMHALEISERADIEEPAVQLKPLREYLRNKHMLLVLDNFEQLLPAASLVAELLAAAPYLKIMVTSRTPLHLYGEHEFMVPPLALPNLARLPAPGELAQLPAVALFVARAQAVQPDFALSAENALAVAALCVHLDGLPLAIELAAAQSKQFTPQALAAQLVYQNSSSRPGATGLRLLRHSWRNLPARHQTLMSAIEWSYQLLEPDEQNLFMQLGIFRGGFTPAAVEAVCADLRLNARVVPPPQPGLRAVAGEGVSRLPRAKPPLWAVAGGLRGVFSRELTSLLDKSLIQYEEREGEIRFSMLETLREYALAQLAACGQLAATRQRHAEFFIALAEQAEPQLMTAAQKIWFKRLERERGNFNAVLSWTLESSDPPSPLKIDIIGVEASAETLPQHSAKASTPFSLSVACSQLVNTPHELGLRLSVALWRFWRYRCYLSEGYFWTQRALLADQNNPRPASRLLRARALWGLGLISALLRKESEATAQLEESLTLAQAEEEPQWIAAALTGLGMLANHRGDSAQAIVFQKEALALYQSQNDSYGMTYAHNALGETLCGRGDYEAGRKQYEASLTISRRLGHRRGVAVALANMAQAANAQGDYRAAHDGFVESLPLFQEIGDQVNTATCLMGLGCVAAAADSPPGWTQAAQLFGFGYFLLEESGSKLQPADQVQIDRHVTLCRQRLGEAAFEVAWAEGRAFSLEQAVACALTKG